MHRFAVCALALLLPAAVAAQSLSDAAEREKERRAKAASTAGKTYTDEDLKKTKENGSTYVQLPELPPDPSAPKGPRKKIVTEDETRSANYKARLKELEDAVKEAEARVKETDAAAAAALQRMVANGGAKGGKVPPGPPQGYGVPPTGGGMTADDPFFVMKQHADALAAWEKAKADLVTAQKNLEDFLVESKKDGSGPVS